MLILPVLIVYLLVLRFWLRSRCAKIHPVFPFAIALIHLLYTLFYILIYIRRLILVMLSWSRRLAHFGTWRHGQNNYLRLLCYLLCSYLCWAASGKIIEGPPLWRRIERRFSIRRCGHLIANLHDGTINYNNSALLLSYFWTNISKSRYISYEFFNLISITLLILNIYQ